VAELFSHLAKVNQLADVIAGNRIHGPARHFDPLDAKLEGKPLPAILAMVDEAEGRLTVTLHVADALGGDAGRIMSLDRYLLAKSQVVRSGRQLAIVIKGGGPGPGRVDRKNGPIFVDQCDLLGQAVNDLLESLDEGWFGFERVVGKSTCQGQVQEW